MTMAKGITSGYAPLGGVLVAPRVADRFFAGNGDAPIFRHGLTYSGHATACVVAETNLDVIEEENLVERAASSRPCSPRRSSRCATHELVADVRAGAGFMAGIQLRDGVSGDAVAEACTEAGVLIRTIHDNTLQICPPFVTTEDEVALIAQTIAEALTPTRPESAAIPPPARKDDIDDPDPSSPGRSATLDPAAVLAAVPQDLFLAGEWTPAAGGAGCR